MKQAGFLQLNLNEEYVFLTWLCAVSQAYSERECYVIYQYLLQPLTPYCQLYLHAVPHLSTQEAIMTKSQQW
jgi:hypothetical protein